MAHARSKEVLMKRFRIPGAIVMLLAAGAARGQEEPCSYGLLHNGPTWDASSNVVSYDLVANAWARDGAYGGGGKSYGMAFHAGGAAVAVASVSFWFKVTHDAVHDCEPVKFESDATLSAEVSTKIHGDVDDYALATGFQAIGGVALRPATLAVAATNAGSPIQTTTFSVTFGGTGFTLTIPGVSVTTDTVDADRSTVRTWGTAKVEEEQITVNCWTKIKVVTNGPFGGYASASVEKTRVTASTTSTCAIHGQTGYYNHDCAEG
jgi:hypothetical protein